MLVKCIKRFKDLQAGTFREVGATFEVDEKRYHAINNTHYGKLVDVVEQNPSEGLTEPQEGTQSEPATKRRGRPKKTAGAAE